MKINPISFGQTFVNSSFQNLSYENKEKLGPSIVIGEYFPMDIFMGARGSNELVVEMTRANEWDYLLSSGEIEPTEENIASYLIQKAFEYVYEAIHGKKKYPVEKLIIRDLDNLDSKDIMDKIVDAVEDYNEKHRKLFEN